jgi:hypothetical protein
METLFLGVRLNKKDIAYVSHTLDSYEGLATVTTIDPDQGLIRVTVSPFFLEEVKNILAELSEKIELELLGDDDG